MSELFLNKITIRTNDKQSKLRDAEYVDKWHKQVQNIRKQTQEQWWKGHILNRIQVKPS